MACLLCGRLYCVDEHCVKAANQGHSMAMQTTGTFPQLTKSKPKPTKKGGKRG